MPFPQRIIATALLILALTFTGEIHVPVTLAINEFETTYNIDYQISPSGSARISQKILLTNKLASVYATHFSQTIEGNTPKNIQASDPSGKLAISTAEISPNEVEISIPFRETIVGAGRSQELLLTYTQDNIATKSGQIWQITIPRSSQADIVDHLATELTFPLSFGEIAYIHPDPTSSRVDHANRIITYRSLPKGTNIIIGIGKSQIYDFSLSYHLENNQTRKVYYEIALLPDTSYQRAFHTLLEPPPHDVYTDADGNWLARYDVPPRTTLSIKSEGYVDLYPHPQPFPTFPTDISKLTGPTNHWQTLDPTIVAIASKLSDAPAIYNYVRSTLDYDYDRNYTSNTRLGSKSAIENPQSAACLEYTDLFIALARSKGIPARELNGFGNTTDTKLRPLSFSTDVLHAWPEYWDKSIGTWHQIDPTWADTTGGQDYLTKFDTDHLVFVIHGQDSTLPRPAGDYKIPGNSERDIRITLGEPRPPSTQQFTTDIKLPGFIIPFYPLSGKIRIRNLSPQAAYQLQPKVEGNQIRVITSTQPLPVLLPFGSIEIPIEMTLKDLLLKTQPTISLSLRNQSFVYSIPRLSILLPLILLVSFLICLLLITLLLVRKVYVYSHFTKK